MDDHSSLVPLTDAEMRAVNEFDFHAARREILGSAIIFAVAGMLLAFALSMWIDWMGL